MSDLEDRLRDALHDLAPADPPIEGLASGAWRHHARDRRRRLAVTAAACVAILAGSGIVVGSLDGPPREVPAGPLITPGDCTTIPQPTAAAGATPWVDPASAPRVRAAWICPDASAPLAGEGWQLPVVPVTARYAQSVSLPYWPASTAGATTRAEIDGPSCRSVQPGPAFTLTQQALDGVATTYRSTDDACGGVNTLMSFLVALADQEADALATTAPDQALACRSDQAWVDGRHGTSLDTPLVTARMCFAPNYQLAEPPSFIQPMVPRSYQSTPIPPDALALLNRDITSVRGSYKGNGACNMEGPWTYSVLGRTQSGQYRMLRTGCLDELFLVGAKNVGFNVSPDTTASLQALVPPG